MMYNTALVLRKHNYGLFLMVRKRLNEALIYFRDDLNMCEYVPEVDIVIKNQF